MRPVKDDFGVMMQLYSRKKIYVEGDFVWGSVMNFRKAAQGDSEVSKHWTA
jgi:hypothetical protein